MCKMYKQFRKLASILMQGESLQVCVHRLSSDRLLSQLRTTLNGKSFNGIQGGNNKQQNTVPVEMQQSKIFLN